MNRIYSYTLAALAVAFVVIALPTHAAFAQYDDGAYDSGFDYGGYDMGSYDSGYGGYDTGAYDSGYGYGGYDYGGYDTGAYDSGYGYDGYDYGSYDPGAYDSSYTYGGTDYTGGADIYGNGGYADIYGNGCSTSDCGGSADIYGGSADIYDNGGYADIYGNGCTTSDCGGSADIYGGSADVYDNGGYADIYGSGCSTDCGGSADIYGNGGSFYSSDCGCNVPYANANAYYYNGGYHTTPISIPTIFPTPTPYPNPTPVCPAGTVGVFPNCQVPTPVPHVCPSGTIGTYPNCVVPTPVPPVQQPPTNVNVNTNTCTDNSCNTNVTNNIANSGNTITTVTPVTPQPIVQYTYPQPICTISVSNYGGYGYNQPVTLTWSSSNATYASISGIGTVAPSGSRTVYPTGTQVYTMTVSGTGGSNTCQTQIAYNPIPVPPPQQNLYCSITASPTTIQNGAASILSWTSYGATSAVLSDGIGSVAVNGSLPVRPEASRTYILTVYGPQGSRTCSVPVSVVGAPSVSLTQIPYTGFDFGPVGNAIYWAALLAFAVAASYLLIYYKGGATALLGTSFGSRKMAIAAAAPAPVVAPAAPKAEAPRVERSARVFENLPAARERSTSDSMEMARSADGTPKIVIRRD